MVDKRLKFSKADFEMGLVGGLTIAIPVFVINLTGGFLKACIAGLAQYAYSFTVIGYNNKICRLISKKNTFLAIILPTTITTLLTYGLHSLINSPEPFWSAMFAFITALPSFLALSFRYRLSDKTLLELGKEVIKKLRSKRIFSWTKPNKRR